MRGAYDEEMCPMGPRHEQSVRGIIISDAWRQINRQSEHQHTIQLLPKTVGSAISDFQRPSYPDQTLSIARNHSKPLRILVV
jgi:hypothetical protein